MSAGFGRGYYGEEQLTPKAPPRKRSWLGFVAVVGAGAALAWLLWPRKTLPPPGFGVGQPVLPPQPQYPQQPPYMPPQPQPQPTQYTQLPPPWVTPSVPSPAPTTLPALPPSLPSEQLAADAQSRGFASVAEYEDAVISTAKQLQSTGGQVSLPPHLQHLVSRLGS